MITYFYKNKDEANLQTVDKYKSGCWVYVENPTEEEISELSKKHRLDRSLIDDALDENEMPRLERSGGKSYLYTRFAYTTDDLEVSTDPVLFVLGGKDLITVSRRRLSRLDNVISRNPDVDTRKPTKLFLQIMEQIDDQFEVYLNGISRQVKTVRSKLRIEEVTNQDFITFVEIEDELNEFLSALTPTNAILKRLILDKNFKLTKDEEELVEDLLLNNDQSIAGSKSGMKSIVSIREAYSTIMSNNLNRVIRILTVATVILAVPTLVSSLYGMNVDLPFERSPMAFGVVLMVSLILSGVTLIILKLKNLL